MKRSCHVIEWHRRGSCSPVFYRKICKGGLQKFWIRYDIEDHTRYLPIDFMYEQLGANFCSNLLNAHVLAGYGVKSSIKKCNKNKAMPIRDAPYFLW